MEKDKPSKDNKEEVIYKGIYINNQRRKKAGGRIRSNDFPNKIEIYGKNQALHESEVEWVEVRRYKKEKRGQRNDNKKKNDGKSQKKEEKGQKGQRVSKLNNKQFKQKNQSKEQDKQKQEAPLKDNKQKKLKYKPKKEQQPSSKKQQETPSESKEKKKVKQEELEQPKEAEELSATQEEDIKDNDRRDEERQERQRSEGSESEKQEEEEQLEIIVGRIVDETKIVFEERPFVGILKFEKRRQKRKEKMKKKGDKDTKENPIQQILNDFYADICPIHARLPYMEMDDLVDKNIQVMLDYAEKELKYDPKVKRKTELNRIIDELSNVYILLTFSAWDGDFPLANIHKIIGKAMTIDGQCDRFLYEHGLNDFAHEQVARKEKLQLAPTELHKPINRMVFTIDPPTSTDLDDALSIEPVGQNLFEVGIHIADVSSYLHQLSWEEILKRTTSVYLPYKTYHMLTRDFVSLCSLDPNQERLCFTIWVTMNRQGKVIGESRIEKHIMKSRFKLSYSIVQDIITEKMDQFEFDQIHPCNQFQFYQLTDKLLLLTEIAKAHRDDRVIFDVFENKELEFERTADRWPVDCHIDKRFTAKKVVQEFMIIGNIEAAKRLIKTCPNHALVIHHPKPGKLGVTNFNETFKILETKFVFEDVMDVQRQLLEVENREKVKDEIKQLCFFKARRVMEAANYRNYGDVIDEHKKELEKQKKQLKDDPTVHFALGLQYYTHFTSPMRRMADIMVHMALTAVISGKNPPQLSPVEVQKINNGRRSTKRLKKDINQVYLALMIYKTHKPIVCDGIISSFGLESVSVYIPTFDLIKEVMWKKEADIHSIKRIWNKDDRMDVKLYHYKHSSRKDVYWVMKKFERITVHLGCTKTAPLRLTVEMEVRSEKGPKTIKWIDE